MKNKTNKILKNDRFKSWDEDFPEEFQASAHNTDGVGNKDKTHDEFSQLLNESFNQEKTVKKLKKGDKVKAEFLSLNGEEAFFSLGPIGPSGRPLDAVVAKSELTDKEGHILHKKGDHLFLYIDKIQGGKISLSTSPLGSSLNPNGDNHENLETSFREGLAVDGKVSETCKGGFRVLIKSHKAFCPIGQLEMSRIEENQKEDFVGKQYKFLITELSADLRNIVVSHRKYLEIQKRESSLLFSQSKKQGDIVQGKVSKIEPFGAFVYVAPGIEGLIHISELSWSRVAHPDEVLKLNQEIKCKILKIEEKDKRLMISLSLKQVGDEPWSLISDSSTLIKEGHVVEGKVKRCMKFGTFVEIAPGIEGLIPLSEMSYTKRVVRSDEFCKEGDLVSVMIKEIQKDSKRILLSLKEASADPWIFVPEKFSVGTRVKGTILARQPFGFFIQLDEGIVGLLPKSTLQKEHPEISFEKYKVGDLVDVQIQEVSLSERRISLRIPGEMDEDEWKNQINDLKEINEKNQLKAKNDGRATLASKFKNIDLNFKK